MDASSDAGGASDSPVVGPLLRQHGFPPVETERLSLRRIEEQCGDRLPADEPERSLVARLIYAAGDPTIGEGVRWSDGVLDRAADALRAGAPLVVDVRMVAAGLDRVALDRLGVAPLVAIDVPEADAVARRAGITRTAAGILALGRRLDGAVVAIGNAPTALLALLDLASEGVARPSAVLGFPVGFVAAAESKEALAGSDLLFVTIIGTRGGSALATAAANLLLRRAASDARTDHNRRHERQPEHTRA